MVILSPAENIILGVLREEKDAATCRTVLVMLLIGYMLLCLK
jgi:hypothetical protein